MKNTKREEIQSEALQALHDSVGNTTLDVSMRVGKTLIVINFINAFLSEEQGTKVLWICEDTKERDSALLEEFEKWGKDSLITSGRVVLTSKRGLSKVNPSDYSLVIFNECHKINSTVAGYLLGFNCKIVGLTGTYPNQLSRKALLKEIGLNNICYKYSTDDAADDNVISDYTIDIVQVPLDTDKNLVITYKDKRTKEQKQFTTSEYASYTSLSNKIDNALSSNGLKFARLNRMRSVSKFQSKIRYVQKKILQNVDEGKKTLIFVMDNKHAKDVGKYIFSSKTSDKHLNAFNKGEIPYLILINKGGTGYTYDIPIDTVILLAPNSTNSMQKIARGMINNKEQDLECIIPISKDTVQVKWVMNSLENIDQSKIKISSV